MHSVLRKMRALVVDDHPVVRGLLLHDLRKMGFAEVYGASNGKDALAQLEDCYFDFIFSDWKMEPISGIELLKEIRNDSRFKKIRFIMVTVNSEVRHVTEAMENGVDAYIIKPFTREVLGDKVRFILLQREKE